MSSVAGSESEAIQLVQVDEGQVRVHLDQVVRGTVEETLNALLEAEADPANACKHGVAEATDVQEVATIRGLSRRLPSQKHGSNDH